MHFQKAETQKNTSLIYLCDHAQMDEPRVSDWQPFGMRDL